MIWNHLNALHKNEMAAAQVTSFEQAPDNNEAIAMILILISEVANVYAPFKYWKHNHVVKRDLAVQLFAKTIISFWQLAKPLGPITSFNPKMASPEPSIQILELYNATVGLKYKFDDTQLKKALNLLFGLQTFLNINDDQLMAVLSASEANLSEGA